MRHFIVLVVVVVLIALLSTAPGTASPGSPFDFVAGAGKTEILRFVVSARSNAAGESPAGLLRFSIEGLGSFEVDITCVLIEGNTARVGGTLSSPFVGNPTAAIGLIDNGQGDQTAGVTFQGDTVASCPSVALEPEFLIPVSRGNIVIHDA